MRTVTTMAAATCHKSYMQICVVCGEKCKQSVQIQSSAGQELQLSHLIEKYAEILVLEGLMCRNCMRRLINMHKSVSNFKHKCQKTCQTVAKKRLNTMPASPPKCQGKARLVELVHLPEEMLQHGPLQSASSGPSASEPEV